jgi:lactam utilization protein B
MMRIDTICMHGETADAIWIARARRKALEGARIKGTRFGGAVF